MQQRARRSAQPLGASVTIRASLITALSTLVISGCCAFAPCHPAMTVAGRVTAASGEPIEGAAIKLHSMQGASDARGCFRLSGADAVPFELDVAASGFKTLTAEAKSGIFQVEVVLAPQDGPQVSTVKWIKSRKMPPEAARGCT